MFEASFGLSGPPFQLSPDPGFYFPSSGHGNALAYMKFGAYQGEGFIVVTGEIGAGKTTLVRTLLEGLDPKQIVAAQIVSTQLEAGDLLRAICLAFGIPLKGDSKAQWLATLEAFLTALCVGGRRALLVVDEAQNLGHREVEELRMLSNFQLGSHALLQSFLVGQPELRKMLQSKSLEQLRQRVIASCHLGPLSSDELQPYVEHRLRHVGWDGRPIFDASAYPELHRHSDGIPRRINLLCTRAMLGAYLQGKTTIEARDIAQTAKDLGAELGEVPLRMANISSL
jgi:general secretion pathway protein A